MWRGSRRARAGCLRLQGHGVRPCPGIGERGQGGASADDYAIASGSDLPFEDARFDLVVAYNVLMDVEDVPATLKESSASFDLLECWSSRLCICFQIAGGSPLRKPFCPLSSKMITLARNALKARKSAMAWNAFRWVVEAAGSLCDGVGGRGSQSRPFMNPCPKPAIDRIICNAGPEFPYFSG